MVEVFTSVQRCFASLALPRTLSLRQCCTLRKDLDHWQQLSSILAEDKNSSDQHSQTTKPNVEKNQPNQESTVTDDDFTSFWNKFKQAILNKNKKEVENFVEFPFKDNYNDVYDIDHSLSCVTANEFMEKYDSIFDEFTIKAIEADNYRGYDKDYAEYGDIIDTSDYLLITKSPNRPKDLVFKKINSKYRLTSIQYYQ
jgi:hypothetical protein